MFKVGDRVFCEGYKLYGTIVPISDYYSYEPSIPLIAVEFDNDDPGEYTAYNKSSGVATFVSYEGVVTEYKKFKIRHITKLEKALV